jgi:hypothetical protein
MVHIVKTKPEIVNKQVQVEIYQASSPSILSLSGGGYYRGIYDIGLKRGFMGYIGLLLIAP